MSNKALLDNTFKECIMRARAVGADKIFPMILLLLYKRQAREIWCAAAADPRSNALFDAYERMVEAEGMSSRLMLIFIEAFIANLPIEEKGGA